MRNTMLTLHPTQESAAASLYIPEANLASAEDENEIVAVITAAIAAYTGNGNFIVKNIVRNDRPKKVSNWVLSGRLEAFERRRVIRK